MRDVGTVHRRLREEAAGAGAAGGEQSPVRAIGSIPLTFTCFSIRHPPSSILVLAAVEPRRPFRDNLRYFEIIRDNLTSRPPRGAAKTNFSCFHLISGKVGRAVPCPPLDGRLTLVSWQSPTAGRGMPALPSGTDALRIATILPSLLEMNGGDVILNLEHIGLSTARRLGRPAPAAQEI